MNRKNISRKKKKKHLQQTNQKCMDCRAVGARHLPRCLCQRAETLWAQAVVTMNCATCSGVYPTRDEKRERQYHAGNYIFKCVTPVVGQEEPERHCSGRGNTARMSEERTLRGSSDNSTPARRSSKSSSGICAPDDLQRPGGEGLVEPPRIFNAHIPVL